MRSINKGSMYNPESSADGDWVPKTRVLEVPWRNFMSFFLKKYYTYMVDILMDELTLGGK